MYFCTIRPPCVIPRGAWYGVVNFTFVYETSHSLMHGTTDTGPYQGEGAEFT